MPATGIPALIFTFYMVPDPATTPGRPWAQVVFGASVAGVYLVFVIMHIAFGLFFALTVVERPSEGSGCTPRPCGHESRPVPVAYPEPAVP